MPESSTVCINEVWRFFMASFGFLHFATVFPETETLRETSFSWKIDFLGNTDVRSSNHWEIWRLSTKWISFQRQDFTSVDTFNWWKFAENTYFCRKLSKFQLVSEMHLSLLPILLGYTTIRSQNLGSNMLIKHFALLYSLKRRKKSLEQLKRLQKEQFLYILWILRWADVFQISCHGCILR